jgi:hypothetical protein
LFWIVFAAVVTIVAIDSVTQSNVRSHPQYFVSIESEAARGVARRIRMMFSTLGLDADVSSRLLRLSDASLPPVTRITGSIPQFFGALSKDKPLATPFSERLRFFLQGVEATREFAGQAGSVHLEDQKLRLQILFAEPRPTWADEVLLRLDLDDLPSDPAGHLRQLVFVSELQSWVMYFDDGRHVTIG